MVNILKVWVTNYSNELAEDEATLAGVKELLAHIGRSAGMEKVAEAVQAALGRRIEEHARRASTSQAPPDVQLTAVQMLAGATPKSPREHQAHTPTLVRETGDTNTTLTLYIQQQQPQRRTTSMKELKEKEKEEKEKEKKKRKRDYLVSIDAEHLAHQICLWDQDIFRRLRASEFMASAWTREDRKGRAPNVCRSIAHFNYVRRAHPYLSLLTRASAQPMGGHGGAHTVRQVGSHKDGEAVCAGGGSSLQT